MIAGLMKWGIKHISPALSFRELGRVVHAKAGSRFAQRVAESRFRVTDEAKKTYQLSDPPQIWVCGGTQLFLINIVEVIIIKTPVAIPLGDPVYAGFIGNGHVHTQQWNCGDIFHHFFLDLIVHLKALLGITFRPRFLDLSVYFVIFRNVKSWGERSTMVIQG